MNDRETRAGQWGDVELRAEKGEDGSVKLVGRAVPYDTWSTGLPWLERFAPGAFAESLSGDVVATVEHDNAKVIGRTSAGTLELRETDEGLDFVVDPLPNTSYSADLQENVRLGNITGNSFEFVVEEETLDVNSEPEERTVTKARLFQVGPVTKPAFANGTEVALRSIERAKEAAKPKEGSTRPAAEARAREIEIASVS